VPPRCTDRRIPASFTIDQSVSHNGICLTVEEVKEDRHRVTAIDETLRLTESGTWTSGTLVNLEQCLRVNGRLDGHMVQGHVDTTGTCVKRVEKEGSWEFTIRFDERFAELVIEKGSVSLNGISLTAFAVTGNTFTVAIIPYTYEHTNIQQLQEGLPVNLEFDLIGKYILRSRELQKAN